MSYVRRAPFVIEVLTLWAKGYGATAIAGIVPGLKVKAVAPIIDQARSIGDKRAVLHCWKAVRGKRHVVRIVGRQDRARAVLAKYPKIIIVPLRKRQHQKRTS